MELQKIKSLIDLLAALDLSELELVEGDHKLRLVKRVRGGTAGPGASVPSPSTSVAQLPQASTQAPEAPAATDNDASMVTAPLYGVVHLAPSPGAPPYVAQGEAVRAGQTLCVMEAMKMFHEVKAVMSARIAAILAGNGQEVEAGQPLFRLDALAG